MLVCGYDGKCSHFGVNLEKFILKNSFIYSSCRPLITQPLYAVYMLMKFSDENVRPCAMTTTFHTSDRYFASVTIGTITIMSIERWLHMSRRSLITVRLANVIYGMLLVLAAVLTGARIWLILVKKFQEGWEPVLRGVLGGLCFLTISLSYFEVFKLIRCHQQQVQASQSS